MKASPRDIVYTLPAEACSNGAGPQQLATSDLRSALLTLTEVHALAAPLVFGIEASK